jgi:uncharacterized DUF497 family protein
MVSCSLSGTAKKLGATFKNIESHSTKPLRHSYDPLAATVEDLDHSAAERRFLTIGYSAQGRLLVIAHTDRGTAIRIINARRATTRERKRHET